MSILSDLISDNIITALGWNIFHILWQGIIIAVTLSLVLRFIKGKSSQIRYLISLCSLFLILGLSVFNVSKSYNNNLNETKTKIQLNQSENNNVLIIDVNSTKLNTITNELIAEYTDKLQDIDRYFPLIVNLWFIGVFICIIKFMLSYFYSCRLKRVNIESISEVWQHRFLKLQEKLKVNRSVQFIESQLVKIPIVLGYLKPVVIIPVEMLSGIPTNQIEAIIAHELAHIKRNDYIINVLQIIFETVFFFHPAVWYISSQIRNERENCCDDLALTVCDGSLVYAKALVSVQELTLNRHYSAVAFSGRKKHLLNRIKRMIMKPKTKSNFTDKIIAVVVILSAVLALSFTYKTDIKNYISENEIPLVKELSEIPTPLKVVPPSIPATPAVILEDTVEILKHHRNEIEIDENTVSKIYRDGKGKKKELKFTLENGLVSELYVDGVEIPESEYNKYQPEIDKTITDLKEAKIDIREAMKDIEELDLEEIHKEMEEAMKSVNIDMDEIHKDIARAMEEVHEIDVEDMVNEIDMKISHLEDLDMDFDFNFDFSGESFHFDMDNIDLEEIRDEMENVRESIRENINMEDIQREIIKAQEELSKIDHEKIKMQMEENMKHFEDFDKKQTIKELEDKLEELEKLELEEKK